MRVQTFIDQERLPYPFCPGCSHGHVLDRLDEAMVRLGLDPTKVVVVTDIGCVGLSDQWFKTHAFHGLHGRSVVYAEGLKIARPELHVIVLLGDGGAGIGLNHLLHAAKRNVGVKVILFNNMNFGMTGGEHSITTPEGAVTSTTTFGHFEKPLRLCETLKLNYAPFVARRAYYDKDLSETIERALAFDGFSFVEVLEFCTAYYVPFNKFDKKSMEAIIESDGLARTTWVDESRIEYTAAYRAYRERIGVGGTPVGMILEKIFDHKLSGKRDIVIAGSAGMKVGSAAALFSRAAILSGLQAVQRDDYPVTVKTGHSLSLVKIAETVIGYMGVETPDILFVISEDGLRKAGPYLARMRENQFVYILDTLPEIQTQAEVVRIHLREIEGRIPKEGIALTVLSSYLKSEAVFPAEALLQSAKLGRKGEIAEKQAEFVDLGRPAIFERASPEPPSADTGDPRERP